MTKIQFAKYLLANKGVCYQGMCYRGGYPTCGVVPSDIITCTPFLAYKAAKEYLENLSTEELLEL